MTKRTAFLIFLVGTLSSAVLFLYLTFDTQKQIQVLTHADRLDEKVVAGKKVWEKYNCNDCHTILGFGGYYAPDMTKAYKRLGPEGIAFVVKNPEKAFASSWRKMPNQGLTDEEVDKLIAFLKWVSEIDNNDWPPQDSQARRTRATLRLAGAVGMSKGAALFKTKGCIQCHSLEGVGGDVGPALDGVGSRYDRDFFIRFVPNPQSVRPDADMPPQGSLTPDEVEALADFLSGLKEKGGE